MSEGDKEEEFPGILLHQAALWGNAELLEDLLHGELLQFLNAKDSHGRTALHAAATNENETCARILLQAGADPNAACGLKEQYKTPLHIASENGHLSISRLLVEYQADILAKDSSGFTAMDLAEKAGHAPLMEFLKSTADDREKHREELHNALWEASRKGDTGKVKQLLSQLGPEAELVINSTPNGCSTLLFKACEEGQKEIVKILLEHGADGRIHPVTKYSPLYIACYYGRKDIASILIKTFPELVRVTTVERWLPIHAAVINGHVPVLDLLLRFSYPQSVLQKYIDKTEQWEYQFAFDINARDVTEQSVLYVACLVGNQRIVDTLLKFRVSAKRVKKEDKDSDSSKKESQKSIDSNVSPTKKKLSNGIQNMISRLSLRNNSESEEEQTEFDINPVDLDLYCNNNTETALHIAVKNKYHNIVSLLLQNGANPNLSIRFSQDDDCFGSTSTALVEACKNRDVNMVDCLVRYGARDDSCKALKVATAHKDEHIVSKLLTLKAYQDPEFKINKKALDIIPSTQLGGLLGRVTFSSMFPTTPVMINWHGQKCLHYIREEWLVNASMAHNVKLKLTPRSQSTALMAITRLDISNNELSELPLCIFQMASLRHLNAAQNKIFKLPEVEHQSSSPKLKQAVTQSGWCCPVLEEIHLHDNRLDSVPQCLFTLPSLTVLDLSNNKLQSLPFKMWSAPKLRELNLSLNMLHDLPSRPPPARSVSASRLTPSIAEDVVTSNESSPRHSTADSVCFEISPVPSASPSLSSRHTSTSTDKKDSDLRQQDLRHHNMWSLSVKVVESSLDDEMDKVQQCQLMALNLAHNAYEEVPPILACFAVNLARLNLSYNRLMEMGSVSSYPSGLKHLDLSHNHIKQWFSLRRVDPDTNLDGSGCYSQFEMPVVPHKSKAPNLPPAGRTQSPSLHSWGSVKSLSGSVCAHRRHTRLENLRTLILADNQLDHLILVIDDDDLEEEDSKSQETCDTSATPGRVMC